MGKESQGNLVAGRAQGLPVFGIDGVGDRRYQRPTDRSSWSCTLTEIRKHACVSEREQPHLMQMGALTTARGREVCDRARRLLCEYILHSTVRRYCLLAQRSTRDSVYRELWW